jgi:hypothetical protein
MRYGSRSVCLAVFLAAALADDYCYNGVNDPVHIHDDNTTILHCLGTDHERLTDRFQGRDYRLTDVHGTVVKGLLARARGDHRCD